MESDEAPVFGSACVLAGGEGRRMRGVDKLRIELLGERLLSRIARSLQGRFDDLIAVTGRPEAFEGLGFRVAPDRFPGSGPAAGLHAGLVAARSRWVYLVACDMPRFSEAWVDGLAERIAASERAGERSFAAVGGDGAYLNPFHGFYERSLAPRLASALEAGGKGPSIQSVLRTVPFIGVDAGSHLDDRLFTSIDTPEELAAAEDEARRVAQGRL